MRRNRRKRNNFYNQNIKNKMEKKQFTITLLTYDDGVTELDTSNDGFKDFELIGILLNVLLKTQSKFNSELNDNNLEKEMD